MSLAAESNSVRQALTDMQMLQGRLYVEYGKARRAAGEDQPELWDAYVALEDASDALKRALDCLREAL